MTSKPSTTNAEIATLIAQNHKEVTARLEAVEIQVKLTNGRVKELERKEIGREAVAAYKIDAAKASEFNKNYLVAILLIIATLIGAGATYLGLHK